MKRREGAFREARNVRFNVIVCDEVHHLADNTSGDDISDRHRLAQWIARASDALVLLSATPHSGYDESFASLLNLVEPTLVTDAKEMSYKHYSRYMVRHLKRHIKKADGTPLFVPAAGPAHTKSEHGPDGTPLITGKAKVSGCTLGIYRLLYDQYSLLNSL